MKKTRMRKSRTLPIEIFYRHIFVRLSVKSLLRFKGVCKQWNELIRDLIKDPNFARLHLHHTKQQNNSEKLIIYSEPVHVYFSLDQQTIRSGDDDIQAVKLQYPINDYTITLPRITTIVGSVNGLVCICSAIDWDKSSTILVWNPTIKVHKVLPPHPDLPVTGVHGIGFGYNSATNDYNVVRVVNGSRIDIYSLKTNSWKLFMRGEGVPCHSPIFNCRFRVCSVDGLIYWFACHTPRVRGILKDLFIACFDLKEVDDDNKKKTSKLIREIPMPRDFGMICAVAELKVMGGCLSVFKLAKHYDSLEMWTMMKINENKNDEVEYKWINRVVIIDEFHEILTMFKGMFMSPVCLSKDGKIVLALQNTSSEFVLYDTQTKSIENLHPIHWMNKMGICMWDEVPIHESQIYIESLVSPNFMS